MKNDTVSLNQFWDLETIGIKDCIRKSKKDEEEASIRNFDNTVVMNDDERRIW